VTGIRNSGQLQEASESKQRVKLDSRTQSTSLGKRESENETSSPIVIWDKRWKS
jgi:hypothetical protein